MACSRAKFFSCLTTRCSAMYRLNHALISSCMALDCAATALIIIQNSGREYAWSWCAVMSSEMSTNG